MVGARISQLRRERNMTQKELAKALSVSPSAIGMYEQGRRQPSAELIVAICKVFAVSTQWLLTGRPYTSADFREDLKMLLRTPLEGDEAAPADIALDVLLEELGQIQAESGVS